jgi:hypothetical protein
MKIYKKFKNTFFIILIALLVGGFGLLYFSHMAKAASGDITAVRIAGDAVHNGWTAEIDISGLSAGGAYNLGLDANNNPIAPKVVFTITSPGYDKNGNATTTVRTVYGTKEVRKPVPNQSVNDESSAAGTLTVKVALSDFVYSGDSNITVNIGSGFYTYGGSNNSVTGFPVTNNSTLSYPKSVGRWAWPSFEKVTGDFLLESVVFNRFAKAGKPLAAVKYTCSDAHSHSVTQIANNMTVSSRSGDANPVLVYAATMPVSTLTQGDILTCNFIAYPWVGNSGSLLNSDLIANGGNGYAQPDERLGPLSLLNDKSGTYGGAFAIIASTGHDSTAGTYVYSSETAAEAAYAGNNTIAYLTIGDAAQAIKAYNNTNYSRNNPGGGVILLEAQNYAWPGTSPGSDLGAMDTWLTIKPAAGVTRAQAIINSGSNQTLNVQKIKVSGVKVTTNGVAVFAGSTATAVYWIDNCALTMTDTAPFYGAKLLYATQNNITSLAGGFQAFSTTKAPFTLLRGNDATSAGSIGGDFYTVIGNKSVAPRFLESDNTASQQPTDNAIVAYNTWFNGNATWSAIANHTAVTGLAIVQNIVEKVTDSDPLIQIAADGSSASADNFIVWNNTFVGERTNVAYNENPSACSASYSRYNWSIRGNIFANMNIMTDTDNTHGCSQNGGRTGNWPVDYMVGSANNAVKIGSSGIYFPTDFVGLRSTTTPSVLGFVHDYSYLTGNSAGNGNYHYTSNSSLLNKVSAGTSILPYDFDGNQRHDNGFGAIGAYEWDVVAPVITAFSASSAGSLSANITLSATDAVGVAGYWLGESNITPAFNAVGWTFPAPVLYSFSSPGSKTLYTWAKDAVGNISSGASTTVSIAADVTPPTISVIASSTTINAATVTWTTNENSTSTVRYGGTIAYGSASSSSALVTSHSIIIRGLSSNTIYHYRVESTDISGNRATSTDHTFRTAAPDITPPAISNIASSTSATIATITWSTNEYATSSVRYGINTSYGSASSSNVLASSTHRIILRNLSPGTTYHFQIGSADASHNLATTTDRVFKTLSINNTFWDDFETKDISAWGGSGTNNPYPTGLATMTSSIVHSGNYALQETLTGSGGQAKLIHDFDPLNEVYARFYFYVDNNWTSANASQVLIFSIGGMSLSLSNRSGSLYLQSWDGSMLGTHSISKGAWHSIEIYSKAGSGNGENTVWLDNTQDMDATGQTISGPFTRVYLGFDNAGTQSGSVYYDDVVLSTGLIDSPAAYITVRYPNTAARSGMPVDVTLFGQTASDQLVASVDGSEVYHKTGSMTGHERFSVILSSLNVGDHAFQVQLQNSGGTPKAAFNSTLHKYLNGTSTVYIDENNIIHNSAAKYFFVAPFIDGQSEWANTWLANSSVNTYGWSAGWQDSYNYTKENFKSFIDSLGAPAIGPDSNFAGASGTNYSQYAPGATTTVAAYVNYVKSDPNLLMWSWGDEPDIGYGVGKSGDVSVETMAALTKTTHNNDANHPVITNHAGYPFSFIANRTNNWYYPIVPNSVELSSDAYSFDMYPLIYSYDNWTVAQLVALFDEADRYTYGLVPWTTDIEAGVCSNGSCTGYGPTAKQVNMESWLAVIHGMKGITWWGPAGWTIQDAAHWTVLSQFVTDTAHFKDVILSTTNRTVASNKTTVHNRVDAMVKEDVNNVYVFASRLSDVGENSDPAINAQLSVSGLTGSQTVTVYNEGRTLTATDGVFTDNFATSSVHIYQIPKSVTPTYTIGGSISGLTGTVVLRNNGKDNLSRSANGSFTFATATTTGATYNVTVLTQPTGQTCSITGGSGSGTVSSANITSVSVTCATNTFTITASTGANGTVTPSGVTTKNYGDSQAYTIATSTAGYHVSNILVDGTPIGTSSLTYTFTNITANHTISATFNINHYTITASAGAHGTISSPGATVVSYGATPAYTFATTTAGYHVNQVLVDSISVSTSSPYTFSAVHANHTISVTFASSTPVYSLTYTAGANGTISGASPQTVASGGSGTQVQANPATGYHFVNWTGTYTSATNPKTDTNVTQNISETANFAINTYTITASAGSNGTVTPSGVTTKNYGDSQSYTVATSTAGYHVSNILVDGTLIGTSSLTYNFTSIAANHTISATFSANSQVNTCASLSNALSYNAYPTCGAATCASGYNLSGSGAGATCIAQSSGGGGGGGGGGGSTPTDTTAPGIPTNFSAISTSTIVILSWTNPTDSDFAGVKLYRKLNSAPSSQTDSSATLIYQGKGTGFIDASAKIVGSTYYYSLYSYDNSANYSQPRTISIGLRVSTSSPIVSVPPITATTTIIILPTTSSGNNQATGTVTTLIGASGTTVNAVTSNEVQTLVVNAGFAPLTTAEVAVYKKIIALTSKILPDANKYLIADFIHYGTPTTIPLGSGERAGSIASFDSAFGRLPDSNLDWQDVVKIGNGRWTTQTSATAEARAKISFKKVYLRDPNMKQANDNAAVNIMAYGLRPAQRNTASEKTAILSFKYIFKKTPTTAVDWDEVRAIAYSGAKR